MGLVSMKFNIHFRAKHVRGRDNRLADSLSRLQVQTLNTGCAMGRPDTHHSAEGNLAQKFGTIV